MIRSNAIRAISSPSWGSITACKRCFRRESLACWMRRSEFLLAGFHRGTGNEDAAVGASLGLRCSLHRDHTMSISKEMKERIWEESHERFSPCKSPLETRG